MRRYAYLAVAAAAAVAAALPATAALADTGAVLTYGSAGGTSVAQGDSLSANLVTGTTANFASSSGGTDGVTCNTSSFTATVSANPAAPGVAQESLTAQTFTDCSSSVFGVLGVNSVTVENLPYTVSLDDSTNAATVTGTIQTTISLSTLFGDISCTYQAHGGSISGTASNANQSLSFANQQFDLTSGDSTCFANGFFTAAYGPVTDTSQTGSPTVYVN